MIVHSQGQEDGSGEMNEGAVSRLPSAETETNGELLFRMVKAKERQLAYQKALLKACQEELVSLKAQIDSEEDPDEKAELVDIVKKFALATQGKKEQFIIMYGEWKTALLKLDIDLHRQKQQQEQD